MIYLSLYKCPSHGTLGFMLECEDGSGVRLTSAKCCGQWTMVKQLPMTPSALRSAAEEFEHYAAMEEKTPSGGPCGSRDALAKARRR